MGAERDFASLLDDLIERRDMVDDAPSVAPSLRFDMLEQIERLQAENPSLSSADARQGYVDMLASRAEPPKRTERAAPLPAADRETVATELGISQRTVEIHRARIREKMEARGLADLIRMMR